MSEPIPMSLPDMDASDEEAVLAVLRSGRLGLGPRAEEFEREMAAYVGVKHGITVSSGTAALHLIASALGLGPGDEVLVPSYTFAASVNAILFVGATPVFVDIEPETYNLDVADLEAKITPRARAIMAVDVFGHPADWGGLERISRKYDIPVIDDSCEALGAEYEGRRIGSFGVAGAFAFYPNKQITTGEGGMIVTDRDDIDELARSLRNQGRGRMGAWLEHERLGYNYRLDEMSAALGVSQLRRLDAILRNREAVARCYTERLAEVEGVRTPIVRPNVRMSWFVYVVRLAEGLERDRVIAALERQGIPSRGYFSPVHRQPYLEGRIGKPLPSLPVTDDMARRTVALPFHNHLTPSQVDRVAEALRTAIDQSR